MQAAAREELKQQLQALEHELASGPAVADAAGTKGRVRQAPSLLGESASPRAADAAAGSTRRMSQGQLLLEQLVQEAVRRCHSRMPQPRVFACPQPCVEAKDS